MPSPTILHCLLDTRQLWPVNTTLHPKEQMQEFKRVAADSLRVIPESDQQSVLKYYHVTDARMSLASQLLKRLAVIRLCKVSWSEAIITRAENNKPFYQPKEAGMQGLDFNVSHQDGIVTLLACSEPGVSVGIDVVSVAQRKSSDYQMISKEGFNTWVDMYAPVFAASEVNYLKTCPDNLDLDMGVPGNKKGESREAISKCNFPTQRFTWQEANVVHSYDMNTVIEAKIRRFYALWGLREAYVKMTGDALLADWLQHLEFVNVKAPTVAAVDELNTDGEIITDIEVRRDGASVTGIYIELRALGGRFMVASALRGSSYHYLNPLPRFEILDLDRDILRFTQA